MTKPALAITFQILDDLSCRRAFFNTESVEELKKWGFEIIVFLLGVDMHKIHAWMQMGKNAIQRVMKRLELRVMVNGCVVRLKRV